MKKLTLLFLSVVSKLCIAQVSITTGSYFQDFGTTNITSWTNNSTFPGWYISSGGSFQGYANLAGSVNSFNAGGYYSYNCGSDSKIGSRASSGAKPLYYGVVLQNNTGTTIKSINVSYTGYQMSLAQNGATNIIAFEYITGATAPLINAAGATGVSALNFTQLQNSGVSGGNQLNWYPCTQRTAISSCVPVTIANGNYILLRWKDDDDTGNDHHMAVDDINVSFDLSGGTCLVFLPIELLNFNAIYKDYKVALNWATASELNNDHFTVERSGDGLGFNPLEFINDNGTNTHNTNYSVIDEQPLNGISYYRLKQTNTDHSSSYSKVVSVETMPLQEIFVFPNPVENSRVHISIGNISNYTLKLIDAMGQIIYQEQNTKELIELDLSIYPKGAYLVQINTHNALFSKKILYN